MNIWVLRLDGGMECPNGQAQLNLLRAEQGGAVPIDEGADLATRIGGSERLMSRLLAPHRLVTCASPAYFAGRSMPQNIEQLAHTVVLPLFTVGGPSNGVSARTGNTVPSRSAAGLLPPMLRRCVTRHLRDMGSHGSQPS